MRLTRVGILLGVAALVMTGTTVPLLGQSVDEERGVDVVASDDSEGLDHLLGSERGHSLPFSAFGSRGGRLGVSLADVTKADVARSKLESDRGALVTIVEKGSAAEKAGLADGDVIVRFDGEAVRSAAALSRMVRETPPDREVSLDVVREGVLRKVEATLDRSKGPFAHLGPRAPQAPPAPRPPAPPVMPVPPVAPEPPGAGGRIFRWESEDGDEPTAQIRRFAAPARLGVRLLDVEGQLAGYFRVSGGKGVLVTSVAAESAAAKAGVEAGDVVLKIGEEAVATASELRRAVRDADGGKALPLSVWRHGKVVELSVTLPEARRRAHRPATSI